MFRFCRHAIGALFLAQAAAQELPRLQHGPPTAAPIGWTFFCQQPDNKETCYPPWSEPRDIELTVDIRAVIESVNDFVNSTIAPVSDLDHWGVLERWSFPTDGRGDCEDFALEKQRLLISAGLPRSALLITVVRRKEPAEPTEAASDLVHAVLTVRTHVGDFILDMDSPRLLPWRERDYQFIKSQSQSNPSAWVALGEVAVRDGEP